MGVDLDQNGGARDLQLMWAGTVAHNNLLEEVAKFRAARRLWAHIASERFGAAAVGGYVASQFGLEHRFIDIDNPA